MADLHIRRKKQKKHQVISQVMFISTCNRCGGYSFFLFFIFLIAIKKICLTLWNLSVDY